MFDTLYNLLIANILHGDALWLNKPSWTCKLTVDNWKFRQMDITGRRSSKRKLFKRYKRLMVVRRGNRWSIDWYIIWLVVSVNQLVYELPITFSTRFIKNQKSWKRVNLCVTQHDLNYIISNVIILEGFCSLLHENDGHKFRKIGKII